MSKVDRMIRSYGRFIGVPWKSDIAPAQRVIFCVYPEKDELRVRASLPEMELLTQQAQHKWVAVDLTGTFGRWLAAQPYARGYFQHPDLLTPLLPKYREYVVGEIAKSLSPHAVDDNTVVALYGVGSLFGLTKVRDVIEKVAPLVPGRLVVLFPGTNDGNNYRLLDAYDGWNYQAVAITGDND